MSKSEQRSPARAATVSEGAERMTDREKTSGRVTFDSRGNAVWEWRTGEKEFAREVSTTLVQRLEASELGIATTAIIRKPGAEGPGKPDQTPVVVVETYNPYNHPASDVAHGTGRRTKTATTPKKTVTTSRPNREGVLQRLQSWIAGKGR
jgi:hypothetical protein